MPPSCSLVLFTPPDAATLLASPLLQQRADQAHSDPTPPMALLRGVSHWARIFSALRLGAIASSRSVRFNAACAFLVARVLLHALRGSARSHFTDSTRANGFTSSWSTASDSVSLCDPPALLRSPALVAQTSYRADAQAQGLELVTVTLAQTSTPKLKTRAILLKQSCSTELQSDDKNSTTFIASQPNH